MAVKSWYLAALALLVCGAGSSAFGPSQAGERRQATGQRPAQPPGSQPAQPPERPPQQPTFRTGINFVRVDVIVTDKQGRAVTDLKSTDFEVEEDGKDQAIESFKLIHLAGGMTPGEPAPREIRTAFDEESEAARDDVRMFVIFFDDYHVRLGASLGVRQPLANFISKQLGPSDLLAVMYPLTPVGDLRMTRNHGAVIGAVERFEGRKYDYRPRNDFEERYAMYPASVVERIRNQVTMSALKGLVTRLGSLREGRKAVILVSEGFTNILPPQLRDPIASVPGYGNPARGSPNAGDGSPVEETAGFFANVDLQSELRDVYDAANRNNAAIYALDPRGLAAAEFDINEGVGLRTDSEYLRSTMDTLRVLADQTDGRAIVNRNDLEKGLNQVVRDSSAYYLLGYNSTQAPSDGKFHEIKVRVTRPGLQVRARKGYWALTADETARALAPPRPGPAPAIAGALARLTEPANKRLIRTWLGTSRGQNGRTRVMFVWEPVPPVPGARREVAARVSLIASAPEGTAYFRGRVPDVALASAAPPASASSSSDGGGAAIAAAGARGPSKVTFEAEPGRLQLRISVEGANAQVLDTDTREVLVPDLSAPQVMISTPRVLVARNALELRSLVSNPDAVPAVGREFRRSDRLLMRFETYGPGDTAPPPTARLLNRAGQPMSDVPVRAAAVTGQPHQIDLPLAGLAVGEYLLEIKAKSEAGEATELIAFRMVS